MELQVAESVLAALSAAEVTNNRLILQGQVDRSLYTKVAQVIEAVGGKWDRRAKAHLFPGDANDALESILLTGTVKRVKTEKQELQAFYSPPAVADRVMQLACLRPGMSVLEPSAGNGALAERAKAAGCIVDCIDVDAGSVSALSAIGFHAVCQADFLEAAPSAAYDRVIMNPPFTRQTDIAHVEHAVRFLKPGGRLVSVMAAGARYRQDRRASAFRDLLADHDGDMEDLPPGSFSISGTGVNAVIVSMERPHG